VNAVDYGLEPARKVIRVLDALRAAYGCPQRPPRDPLEVLVRGILSQNTSDVNSGRAYESLRAQFPTWSQVAEAEKSAIAKAIECGGLAEQKSNAIKSCLEMLYIKNGASLDYLERLDVAAAQRELTAIKGVGIKTARLVLLFGFGQPVFVVDTHVHRVVRRLGLVPERTSREKAHKLLDELVPDERTYEAHMNLIRHGRQCCRARNPLCIGCCLAQWCRFHRATSN